MLSGLKPKKISLLILRFFTLIFILILLPITPVLADGEAGNAVSFDGVDDYVFLGQTNTIMNGTTWKDSKTVSMWIKPEGVSMVCAPDPSNCDAVFGDRPRWWGISRGIVNGEDRIWVWNFDTNADYVGVQYSVGEWVHITLVHDAGVLTVYKNGQFGGSVNSATTDQPNTGGLPNLQIGGVINASNNWTYQGVIDEVRIYNTALSQSDIQNTMFTELIGNESGLAAYYTMNTLNSGMLPDDRVDALGDPVSDPHNGTLFGATVPTIPFLTASTAFDKPVTMDQTITVSEDSFVNLVLFGEDPQDDPLILAVAGAPAHGEITGSGVNRTYTPDLNFFGQDSFTYTASDVSHTSAVGVITINVTPVNDPPVATDQDVYTPMNTAVPITLSGTDIESSSLNFVLTSIPTHGVISGQPPNVTYTPTSGYVGMDSFTFNVRDNGNLTDSGLITIHVESVNIPPVADNQTVNTDEDTAVPILLTASDVEGDPFGFTIDTSPTKGVLTGTAPNLIYTPNPDQNGDDSFTFYASDADHDGPLATVSITINPVNDAPLADDQSLVTDEDVILPITLTGSDVDGDGLTFSVVDAPQHGDLSGTVPDLEYTPDLNYHGEDSFTFRVNDGTVNSVLATISIDVLSVNDIPTVDNQFLTVNEDMVLPVTLSGSDADGDVITYSVIDGPQHGSLDGTAPNLEYTPDPNFTGADSFTFRSNDGLVNSVIGTISIAIDPINDAPVADAQSLNTNEDTGLAITLSGSDVDGDVFTFENISTPAHGTLTGTVPNLTYTPDPNFYGSDSFQFRVFDGTLYSGFVTITIQVSAVNDAPTANVQSLSTNEDTPLLITLTGSDIDGDLLNFEVVNFPSSGGISGTPPNLTYTPNVNFNGADQLTFRTNDGTLNSTLATINITIHAVNDIPLATPQSLSLNEDSFVNFTLSGTDIDGDELNFSVTDAPDFGMVSGTIPNLTYTPGANYFGTDSLTFVTNDGTVNSVAASIVFNVDSVNDAPVAQDQNRTTTEDTAVSILLTGSDVDGDSISFTVLSQPQHGSLSGTEPNLVYHPDDDYQGPDQFTFRVTDGILNSNTATIAINVSAVNDPPTANPQTLIMDEDTGLGITLSGNDPEGVTLSFDFQQPTYGILSGTAPNLTYTPESNYNGLDSFTFTVSDGLIVSTPAVVEINVNPVEDVPAADDQNLVVEEDTPLDIILTGSDADGDLLSFSLIDLPMFGSLTGSAPNLTYTPDTDFYGADVFTFRVNDGTADSELATVFITVTAVNDTPSADDQTVETNEDTNVDILLTGSDPDGDFLSFVVVDGPSHGQLSGTVPNLVYIPDADYFGMDQFTFLVHDGSENSQTAVIMITVTSVADLPVGAADTYQVYEDEVLSVDALSGVLSNDMDADGDPLSVELVSDVSFGTLVLLANGSFEYTPQLGFTGQDQFIYKAFDGGVYSAEVIVTIEVLPGIPVTSGFQIFLPLINQ